MGEGAVETFFLAAFAVGLSVILASFLFGFADAELPLPDLPDLPGGDAGTSPLNMSTIAAFLAWFGGVGYLLSARTALGLLPTVLLSSVSGLAGASVVFVVVVRYVLAGQTAYLEAGDFRLEGVLARVSAPMAGSRLGEVTYERGGTTRSEGARSTDGAPLARGEEVVILRYEKGVAWVEPLDRLLAERGGAPDALRKGE